MCVKILFIFLFIGGVVLKGSDDVITVGQMEFGKVYNEVAKRLDANGHCSPEFLDKTVKPLLLEVIHRGEWDDALKNKDLPPFTSFLCPKVGKHPNPFMGYALFYFLSSDRFKNSDLLFKQIVCFKLVTFIFQTSNLVSLHYEAHHQQILKILFQYFHEKKFYNSHAIRFIKEYISSDRSELPPVPSKGYLLLWLIDNPELYQIKKLTTLANNCESFDRKKIEQWIALVLIANKDQQDKYLPKLIEIINKITSKDMKKATYMFPYLCLVQKHEIIDVMKKFLQDDNIIDQGDDIMHRYTGMSFLAVQVLYTMIDDFPKFSRYDFNQDERKKCLKWLEDNKEYKFRKIDFWVEDPIISRMRYMIFEVR